MVSLWRRYAAILLLGCCSGFGQPATVVPCALLTLNVTPSGATTLLNGQTLDQNVWLVSLLPGTHTLEVRLAGFKPFARELDLAPGARMQLSVNLQKEP